MRETFAPVTGSSASRVRAPTLAALVWLPGARTCPLTALLVEPPPLLPPIAALPPPQPASQKPHASNARLIRNERAVRSDVRKVNSECCMVSSTSQRRWTPPRDGQRAERN